MDYQDYKEDDVSLEESERIIGVVKELVESAGWRYYRGIVEAQQTVRLDGIVLTPLENVLNATLQEYMKGEIAGMRMALTLPTTQLELHEENAREKRAQREHNTEGGDQQ